MLAHQREGSRLKGEGIDMRTATHARAQQQQQMHDARARALRAADAVDTAGVGVAPGAPMVVTLSVGTDANVGACGGEDGGADANGAASIVGGARLSLCRAARVAVRAEVDPLLAFVASPGGESEEEDRDA
jgi:hypothetical protein